MKVLVAQKMGFCFGVEHAISTAEKLLTEHNQVYCLGHLIHNRQVVQRLAEKGLRVVDSLEEIGNQDQIKPTVLIRSHGCRPEVLQEVKDRGLELVDATCVLVKRAQNLVDKLHNQGYQVIVVGDPDHPEIQGVVGYAPDVIVIDGPEAMSKLPESGKLAIISQTTHSIENFGKIVGLIATKGFDELKVVNTICRETSRRQASAIELCHQVDVMFVLGSHHSANTGELAELCRRNGVETYHLQDWSEFKTEFVNGKTTAGITAGASTPNWVIKPFIENLEKL
ncbi:MAG: 4-hydroxy-3-methylbut-2-enyl diphosphate reductase [Phycisphaerae bacterium]|nr:4-hydroxy-3-methylbut-2-enyl diphosphate reductase [Phycisphaerae bacterium]